MGEISLTLGLRLVVIWAVTWYCLLLRCSIGVWSLFIGIAWSSTSCPLTALITDAWLLGLRAIRAHSFICRIFFRCRLSDFLRFGDRRGAGEGRLSCLCLAEGGLVRRKSYWFLVFGHNVQVLWIWSLLSKCEGILLLQSWCLLTLCRAFRVPSHLTWISILPNGPKQDKLFFLF